MFWLWPVTFAGAGAIPPSTEFCCFFFVLFCFFFSTFYGLSNGSLVICHWACWCPGHQLLQCFDCNNKLVSSISLKVFYSFMNITLPPLHIFREHTFVPLILLLNLFCHLFHFIIFLPQSLWKCIDCGAQLLMHHLRICVCFLWNSYIYFF